MITRKTFTRSLISAFALSAMSIAPNGLASAAEQSAAVTSGITNFRLDYTGSLFIFPMGTLTLAGQKNSYGYSMRADMDTAGIAKMTKSGGLWSTSVGYYDKADIRPTQHVIQKLNKKGRRVEINYDAEGAPTSTIAPRFGSMGQPAASDAERAEAVDALSGIMQLMMTGHTYSDAPCSGSVPIFDGKQRYDLRLEKAGNNYIRQSSYKGETVRCHVYMETVSGYDTEDLLTAEEAATPIVIYLAEFKEAGLWVPVRFDYRVSGIKVNIKATNIDISNG